MTGLRWSARRVAANTVSKAVASSLAQGSKAVAALLVARELGAEALGVFSIVLVVAAAVGRCATLGVDTLLVREMNRPAPLLQPTRALRIALSGAALSTFVLLVAPRLAGAGDDLVTAFAASAVLVLLTPAVLVLAASFQARERVDLEAWPLAAEGVIAIATVAAVLHAGGGVPSVLLILGLCRLVNVAVSAVLHARLRAAAPAPDAPLRAVLHQSSAMWGSSVVRALLQRVDVLLLALFVDARQVGLYVAASTVVLVLADVGMHFTYALYPVLCRARDGADPALIALLRVTTRRLVVVLGAAALLLAAVASPLVVTAYGQEFAPAASLLVLLAALLPLRVVTSLWGLALTAGGRQYEQLLICAGALAAAGLAVPVAAAARGASGVALAVVAVELLIVVLFRVALRRLQQDRAIPSPRSAPAPHEVLDVDIGGAATIRVSGLQHASPALRRWVQDTLEPLRAVGPRRPDVLVTLHAALPPRAAALAPHPVGIDADGACWVVDHLGRAAVMRADAGRIHRVEVDGRMGLTTFDHWVWAPVAEAAVTASGAVLLRAACVDVAGRRIAVVGRTEGGKTRLACELLARGAGFVGDDVVVVRADGTVAPATAKLLLRDQARRALPGAVPAPSRRRRVACRTAGALSRLVRQPALAYWFGELARGLWKSGAVVTGVRAAFPDAVLAGPGRVDEVIVLVPAGLETSRFDLVSYAAAQGDMDRLELTVLQAAVRLAGARCDVDLVPDAVHVRAVLRTALAGVPISRHAVDRAGAALPGFAERLAGPSPVSA